MQGEYGGQGCALGKGTSLTDLKKRKGAGFDKGRTTTKPTELNIFHKSKQLLYDILNDSNIQQQQKN